MTRPLLIYDGDCSFCEKWVERWKKRTGDRVNYEPYQKVARDFPRIPEENFAHAVQLVDEGKVYSAAEAVFRILAHGGRGMPLRLYRCVPGLRFMSEIAYHLVARYRARRSCAIPQR